MLRQMGEGGKGGAFEFIFEKFSQISQRSLEQNC